jgi:hypothetical protein
VVGFGASEACDLVRAAGLEPHGPDLTPAPTTGVVTAQRPIAAAGAEQGDPVILWTRHDSHGADEPAPPPLAPASPEPVPM